MKLKRKVDEVSDSSIKNGRKRLLIAILKQIDISKRDKKLLQIRIAISDGSKYKF